MVRVAATLRTENGDKDLLELENLLSIALAFFIVTVSPGPANIAVATVAMRSGRKHGLPSCQAYQHSKRPKPSITS